MVAAIQTVVIGYGLEKFYQTFSRSWVVTKNIFNLLISKLEKEKEVEEKEKEKKQDVQMKKIKKSSVKRFGAIL